MTLGVRRVDVVGLVLGQSVVLTAVGMVACLGGAFANMRYLQGILLGLTPLHPTTFVGVSVIFGPLATLAGHVPARRAATLDPLVALRREFPAQHSGGLSGLTCRFSRRRS